MAKNPITKEIKMAGRPNKEKASRICFCLEATRWDSQALLGTIFPSFEMVLIRVCSKTTHKGTNMAKIIQTSIILIDGVRGKCVEMPMNKVTMTKKAVTFTATIASKCSIPKRLEVRVTTMIKNVGKIVVKVSLKSSLFIQIFSSMPY